MILNKDELILSLQEKVYEKIEEIRQEIAESIFAQENEKNLEENKDKVFKDVFGF